MELLNSGGSLDFIAMTAGWGAGAFRAYLWFRIAGKSDMRIAIIRIKNLPDSDSDDDDAALASRSSFEAVFRPSASSGSSSDSPTSSYV